MRDAWWPHRAGLAGAVSLGLLVSTGCASFPRLTRPPVDAPAGAEWVTGAGEVRLYTSTVLPDGAPVGVVSFVLGPGISSAPLYPRFVAALRAAGFAVAVLHPRGTGYSDGLRGDLEDFGQFLGDQRLGLAHLRRRFPSTPLFLFGHSAGAAFALELAATSTSPLAGLVLVNPAYKLVGAEGMTPSFGDYLVYAANAIFRSSALTADLNSRPSAVKDADDRAEAEAMQRDPLTVRYFSMRFLFAQKEVMDRCAANAAAATAPVLLVQGARDGLVNPRGNDELLAAAKTTDKVKLIAPDGGHGSSAVETLVEALVPWLQERCCRRGD